jgi:hypothetical protein
LEGSDIWVWSNGRMMISSWKPEKHGGKPASLPLWPLWTSHDITQDWTQGSAARN